MACNYWIVLRDHPKWMENPIMTECSTQNRDTLNYLYYYASHDFPNSTSFQKSKNEVESSTFLSDSVDRTRREGNREVTES